MRKIASLLLAFALVLGFMPISAQATENRNIIILEDGSYIEIHVDESNARITNEKSGTKTYSCYDSSDTLQWQAKLSATFTYNGTIASCTSASCSVTIYESKWYEISNATTRSGNMATTALTMGKKFLGITVSRPEYTITLTCDKDGNLS